MRFGVKFFIVLRMLFSLGKRFSVTGTMVRCFNCISIDLQEHKFQWLLAGALPNAPFTRDCHVPNIYTTPLVDCLANQCYEIMLSGFTEEGQEYIYVARGCRNDLTAAKRSDDKCESGLVEQDTLESTNAVFVQHVICSQDLCNTNIARLYDCNRFVGLSSCTICSSNGKECNSYQKCDGNWCFKKGSEIITKNEHGWRSSKSRRVMKGCSPVNFYQSAHCTRRNAHGFDEKGRSYNLSQSNCMCRGSECNSGGARSLATFSSIAIIISYTVVFVLQHFHTLSCDDAFAC